MVASTAVLMGTIVWFCYQMFHILLKRCVCERWGSTRCSSPFGGDGDDPCPLEVRNFGCSVQERIVERNVPSLRAFLL